MWKQQAGQYRLKSRHRPSVSMIEPLSHLQTLLANENQAEIEFSREHLADTQRILKPLPKAYEVVLRRRRQERWAA
jgi:hypothetical protein